MQTAAGVVQTLGPALSAKGLDVLQPLSLSWYNAAVPPELGVRITPAGAAGAAALVLIVGNTRALWGRFVAACAADRSMLEKKDPLDSYVEDAVLQALAACCSGAARPRVLWSHRPADGLDGGGCYVAMQRMAACAGLAFLEEVCHLSMHPVYGPWYSLRCAVCFDDITYDKPQPRPLPNPLSPQQREAVEAAMREALSATAAESAEDGRPSMAGVREAWRLWLAVRDSSHPAHPWRYSDEQAMYHYSGGRRRFLEAAVQRALQEQSAG